jgi:hypothetical protein
MRPSSELRHQARIATDSAFLHRPARAGMLIYKLLGDEAESSFARSWGISYGLNSATEWKARGECALHVLRAGC